MFSFDITLIFQMIHFFFAWWFLDRFLFKYLVSHIHQEHTYMTGLQRKLEEEVHTLQVMMQQKDGEWTRFKNLYKEKIPEKIDSYSQVKDIAFTPPKEISEKQKVEIIHDISQKFIQEISHD